MLAWPLPLHAQKPPVPVIGLLSTASPASRGGDQVGAFHGGLRQEGYTEGGNVRIEYRWARDDYVRLRAMAEELVRLRVAVIVAAGGHVSALVAHELVTADPMFNNRRAQVLALTARHSLPAIYQWREFVTGGGLMSYGPSITEAYRQAGINAGLILKGAKPADIPVVQPTKFQLVINRVTAGQLGLTVSPALLAIADEVIE